MLQRDAVAAACCRRPVTAMVSRQCVAVRCIVLQCSAGCCREVQGDAVAAGCCRVEEGMR